jgi:hypothetical protein
MKNEFINIYSDKELIHYWKIDELQLHLIKTVIELDNDDTIDDCLGMFKSVQQLRKQCFNKPDTIQEKLTVLNELMDGHGIEPIQVSEELYQDSYYGNVIGEYVNLGDPYNLTIVYNTIEHEFEVITWGDYFEVKEGELKSELDDCPY